MQGMVMKTFNEWEKDNDPEGHGRQQAAWEACEKQYLHELANEKQTNLMLKHKLEKLSKENAELKSDFKLFLREYLVGGAGDIYLATLAARLELKCKDKN